MENWPPGPSNPSPPPRVSRPPPGFPNPPPRFEPLPSTQPLFVNINNNTPLLYNNAPPLENIHHPPPNIGNQDFPNPPNILDFVHPNNSLTSTTCFVNVVAPQGMKSECSETVSTTYKYLEGQSMQRPPLFESDHYIYCKNRFETYVEAKDLNLWHIILNGDFPPLSKNEVTQILEVVPFEQQDDDLKKKLAKNNEAKMVLYNALPKKEYERIFMCKTAKDIWQSLLITHQGNSQVKDNKIDLLVQQSEQFSILEEESIDSGFARFNTFITSLKALDEDLSSLALDELIGNLKVHEVVMEKDSEIYKGKKERIKSIALKAKKESSDDETSTSGSDDEEYAMAVRNFKKFFRRKGKYVRQPREERKSFRQRDEKKGKSDRKCFRCGDPSHLIGDCPKTSRNKDQKAFIGGSWSDTENDAEDKTNDETCLMLNHQMSLCEISLKIINKNKILKTKRDLLEKEILELNEKIKKLERSKEIEMACKSCDELKLENAKLKETQVKFVKFDKSANSLREMLNNQKSPSCKIGLGFDSDKASTSGTKTMSFVGSFAEKGTEGSTIKGHGSTLPGSVSRKDDQKGTEHVFSPPLSSRSDFVITRKKLIHNSIDESKKPSLKPSLKSGIGYVKTESRSKTPPPRRNISSQPRYNTPQSRRNSRQPIH
ncbi:zf-CCHC domain-containing protein [Tanacetum coccineum]